MRIVLACFVLLAACEKPDTSNVDAVNALVAPKHAYRLRFEQREVTTTSNPHHVRFKVDVPQGWKLDEYGLAAPVDKLLNGDSSLMVASSCEQEPCVEADWNAQIDQLPEMALMAIKRDERSKNRRVIVGTIDLPAPNTLLIRVYWWKDGGAERYACTVRLGAQLVDSAAAFEKACQTVTVL